MVKGLLKGINREEDLIKYVTQCDRLAQFLKFAEESGELTRAINKLEFGSRSDLDNVHEEFADTLVMMDQIRFMYPDFDINEVHKYYNAKVDKLMKKINV